MNCREFAEFLDDYLAGEQPAEVRAVFEMHLEGCSCCNHYLSGYRETIKLGKSLCNEPCSQVPGEVPDQLLKAVMEAIKTCKKQSKHE